MMLFLTIGGHRVMVRALLDTFTSIPPGSFRATGSHAVLTEQLLTETFIVGLRLAAPAVTALFIASLTMGLIARTVPQLNILTIGFQIRVLIGIGIAAISLSLAFDLLHDAILSVLERVGTALGVGF
jgi:flagellar biosynthesis protein FliR